MKPEIPIACHEASGGPLNGLQLGYLRSSLAVDVDTTVASLDGS